MSKNPREPKHVKALIAKHRKKHLEQPKTTIGEATLWSRIKLRKSVPPKK